MGEEGMSQTPDDPEFRRRREEMRKAVNALDHDGGEGAADRRQFFDAVYEMAGGDAAGVPWADLAPKPQLADWLTRNPGEGRAAIDIACGLGDNAEALAAAGYRTTAFDLAETAIGWARQRFPDSPVDYRVADMLNPPDGWTGGFDLVNECYTIQSVPLAMRETMTRGVAALVKPGGTLLVYARTRPEGSEPEGPPWPLSPAEASRFAELGLTLMSEETFDIMRSDKTIPHVFAVWQRPSL
jgi:SAM-dependent methyltransferase